jgi:hypothetical protein
MEKCCKCGKGIVCDKDDPMLITFTNTTAFYGCVYCDRFKNFIKDLEDKNINEKSYFKSLDDEKILKRAVYLGYNGKETDRIYYD